MEFNRFDSINQPCGIALKLNAMEISSIMHYVSAHTAFN